LNSLEEKITAHFGTIYLISFTKGRTHQNILFRWNNENEVLVMFYQYFTSTEALITFKMFR